MKLFDKKDVVKIAEDDLKDAKLSSIDFKDDITKKRAFINVLGARLAMKLLFSKKIEANNLYSLYTIHNMLEELDIADIYFQGIKIDVRLVFNKEEIFIPKSHFKYDLLPDLYVVLGLEDDLSSAELLGFFEPKELDKTNANKDFYFFEYEKLSKPDKIKNFLDGFVSEDNFNITDEDFSSAEELFLPLVDKEITKKDKLFLFNKLAKNITLREQMVEFENFELLSNATAKNEILMHDGLLDIIGAQTLFNEEGNEKENLAFVDVKTEDDSNFEIIEDEKNEFLHEEKEEKIEKSDSKVLESGLNVVAAGLGLGGAIVAGAAGVAMAQDGIAKGSADIAVAGIGLGSDIISNTVGQLSNQAAKTDGKTELSFNGEDEANATIDNEISDLEQLVKQDELPEIDSLDEYFIDSDDDIPEFKPEGDFLTENQEALAGLNNQDDDKQTTENQEFKEIHIDDFEAPAPLEEIEAPKNLTIEDLPALDKAFEEPLEELPEIKDFEEIALDESPTEQNTAENVEKQDEEEEEKTFNLDDFDFEILDENQKEGEEVKTDATATDNELVSFDSIKTEQSSIIEPDDEALERIRAMEDEEENDELPQTTYNENKNQSEDLVSQVDDFLKDVKLSDEQINLLEDALALTEDEEKELPNALIQSTAGGNENLFEASADKTNGEDNDMLKVLFKNEQIEKIPDIDFEEKRIPESLSKKKKMIIAASAASIVLVSLIAGGTVIHNKNMAASSNLNAPIAANGNASSEFPQDSNLNGDASKAMPETETDPMAQQPVQGIPGENQQADASRDMGKAVSDAFLSEPVNASISKIAWEVPEDLAYNDSFRKYLQTAGKNMKLNLQNDLLLATEMAYSNKVVLDLEISKDGSLTSENVVTSSGSKQIDKIVLQSVKETLKYLKMPSSEVSGGSAPATLIINF